MWIRRITILFYVSGFLTVSALSQEIKVNPDSTILYKKIETFSKRNKFNNFLYHLIFKPISIISKKEANKKVYKKLIQKPYATFEGKFIRKIDIVTLDPFGNSVNASTEPDQNWIIKAGN